MKIEHIAIAANSIEESDKFFIHLLGLKKEKNFTVNKDLMEKFFGIAKSQEIVRYSNKAVNIEVFITKDNSKAKDIFTHCCLIFEERDKLVFKANSLGFKVIKVPRENSNNYYLFIKDSFGNLFEIKSP